jgi:hypothetical protein
VGDIAGIAMRDHDNRMTLISREEPPMEFFSIRRIEIDIPVIEVKIIRRNLKISLGEKDIEVFDFGVKDYR